MKRRLLQMAGIVAMLSGFAGCADERAGEKVAAVDLDTACGDPRPQICTQDYVPVCARLDSDEWKTYGNGCNACADRRVFGYKQGACPD